MKRALVLSAEYKKAYPVVMSLKRLGYKVTALFTRLYSYCLSRYIDERVHVEKITLDVVKHVVERYSVDLVVPTSYQDYDMLSRTTRLGTACIPLSELSDVELAADKFNLSKICEKLNLRYPRTILVNIKSSADVHEIVERVQRELTFPVVVKGRSDASRPVYIAYPEDLREELRKISGEVIVQEYIPGVGCGYFAVAVNGKPLVEYTHVRVVEEKASGGPSVRACVTFDPELVLIGRRVLSYLRWTGPLMVEMKRHIETGDIYIIELNPKLWGSLELAVAVGIDIPCELAKLCDSTASCRHVVRGRRCFTWLLASMHYLRENPSVWLFLLGKVLQEGVVNVSDIHIFDPPELMYAVLTRLRAVMSGKWRRSNWKETYWRVMLRTLRRLHDLKLILFDLDGTLIDIPVDWKLVQRELVKKGYALHHQNVLSALYRAWIRGNFTEVSDFIKRFEIEAIRKVKLSAKVASLLARLRRHDVMLGIVTKQSREAVDMFLRKFKLSDIFDVVSTREDAPTKREQVRMILTKLSVKSNQTLLIGDSLVDLHAALSNYVTFIGVARTNYHLQMFTELGVAAFRSMVDILKLIDRVLDRATYKTSG